MNDLKRKVLLVLTCIELYNNANHNVMKFIRNLYICAVFSICSRVGRNPKNKGPLHHIIPIKITIAILSDNTASYTYSNFYTDLA